MRLERSGREEVCADRQRGSGGLMHGVMISAGLYLLAAMVWLAI